MPIFGHLAVKSGLKGLRGIKRDSQIDDYLWSRGGDYDVRAERGARKSQVNPHRVAGLTDDVGQLLQNRVMSTRNFR